MPSLPEYRLPYVAPSAMDSRSPCPALNSLANHGYIPHDGHNITLSQLVSAIHRVYGISIPAATILALGGLVKCGHREGLGLVVDLHDLAKHNALEHDASLVHANTPSGDVYAPTAVDQNLLRQLLATSDTDSLTLDDLCRAQVARVAASPPLASDQAFVSKGELCLIHQVFGVAPGTKAAEGSGSSSGGGDSGLVVPKAFLEQWLGQEMLPTEWHGPLRGVGVLDIVSGSRSISALEQTLSHPAA